MSGSTAKIPVIIDTDPGVDDVIGILLALASPELEVLAITVTFGNTSLDCCSKNVFNLYDALARHFEAAPDDRGRFPNFTQPRKTILALGAEKPTHGSIHTAQYFHGRDGLGDITTRHPDLQAAFAATDHQHPQLEVSSRSAIDVSLGLIQSEPDKSITYIALGPLTNLSGMLKKDPTLVKERLGRVVCMGGALGVPGNCTPVAEFNFFADPHAVYDVLTPAVPDQGFPLERFILVPLDVTTTHEMPFPLYRAEVDPEFENTSSPSNAARKPPLSHFTSAFLERTREVMLSFGKDAMELHDPVAVWFAIENPPGKESAGQSPLLKRGWRATRRQFQVERTGEFTRGMLVVDRRDDAGVYAPGDNRSHVQQGLNWLHISHRPPESVAVPAPVLMHMDDTGKKSNVGVFTVVETPGPGACLDLLFRRVWGVYRQP
ncbi:nucleoside hydrolase [Thelephora ganbajun]|uniref:Nucleoside hydrolase n=1 Tax=Thelephora ganbajun TaxID=370292 RepID=A0ACB6ZWV5_THEGA|nr:nucleoside hydrolase [Thelephora ganbajun]